MQQGTGLGRTVRTATVLLTGADDLLVPALARRLLRDGHRVLVPAPPLLPGLSVLRGWGTTPSTPGTGGPEVVEHDPEDPEVPAALARGVDLVLHVDAGPVGTGLSGRSASTLDALFALRVAEVNDARLVVAASASDEHQAAVEGLLEGYRSAHDLDAVLVRATDCYGPGADGTGVVARMLRQAAASGRVVVDARDRRRHRPCFVDDVVDVLLHVLLDRTGPVGTRAPVRRAPGVTVSTLELAEQVCRATGADLRVVGLTAATPTGLPGVEPDGPVDLVGARDPGGVCEVVEVVDLTDGARSDRVDLAEGLRRCVLAGTSGLDRTGLDRTGLDRSEPLASGAA